MIYSSIYPQNLNIQTLDDIIDGPLGSGYTIRRLPVKVLGKVGSPEDEIPRPSKGLPEVVIAGRSNVGKSTLLNVSLYF